jgi:UDP-glucuronate 4-epimerase
MSILVTGAAGFIGFHVCRALLDLDEEVVGLDDLNDYYDVALKERRRAILEQRPEFTFQKADVADRQALAAIFARHPAIDRIVHLAAQAGVRYSLINPYAYVHANLLGQVTMFEAARAAPKLRHLVYASSSSVYGDSTRLPFALDDRADRPRSLYGATKRSGEMIARSYAALFNLPATGLRFFTVYGPWGRPDMSAYLFTKAILEGRPITLFNNGEMKRDFTYVDDIVSGVLAALARTPRPDETGAPHRLYNLGNHRPEPLTRFVALIEEACGRKAEIQYAPMQPGDVPETYAEIEDSRRDLGFEPKTSIDEGIPRFVAWFREYHKA